MLSHAKQNIHDITGSQVHSVTFFFHFYSSHVSLCQWMSHAVRGGETWQRFFIKRKSALKRECGCHGSAADTWKFAFSKQRGIQTEQTSQETMLTAHDSNLILQADSYILKRVLILDITNTQYRMMCTYFVLNHLGTHSFILAARIVPAERESDDNGSESPCQWTCVYTCISIYDCSTHTPKLQQHIIDHPHGPFFSHLIECTWPYLSSRYN